MAQLEVELDTIAEGGLPYPLRFVGQGSGLCSLLRTRCAGKNVVLKWQGKPLFVRHRTAEEIATAVGTDIKDLKDAVNDPADSVRLTPCLTSSRL